MINTENQIFKSIEEMIKTATELLYNNGEVAAAAGLAVIIKRVATRHEIDIIKYSEFYGLLEDLFDEYELGSVAEEDRAMFAELGNACLG